MRPDRARYELLLTFFAVCATLAPHTARAWCRLTTSQLQPATPTECITEGVPLAWTQPCMSYAIYAPTDATGNLTPSITLAQLRSVTRDAFATWVGVQCDGQASPFTVRQLDALTACDAAVYNQSGGNVAAVAFVSDWAARRHSGAAYALTTVWHNTRTGQILDADLEINTNRGPYAICPDSGCTEGSADLANVLTHEAGHFFGLAHSAQGDATMYAMAAQGETLKRNLTIDDREGFCAIYPPGSITSACNDTPRGGLLLASCKPQGGCACSAPTGGEIPRGPLALVALAGALVFVRRRARR